MADAEAVLRKLIHEILDKLNYNHPDVSIESLTSSGANYTSALFTATVTSPTEDEVKLFAKVANVNEAIRSVMKVGKLFSTEHYAYTDLATVYNKLQDKYNIPDEDRFEFPKFYGSHLEESEETIVLENLTANGYGTYNRFKSVDWEHMAACTKKLARFHALSFAYNAEDPESYEKCTNKFKVVPEVNNDPHMTETWKKLLGGAVQVVQDEYRENLVKYLSNDSNQQKYFKFKMPIGTPVLCHGDYRVSNLMFRRQGESLKTILVDYQMIHSGSPVADLLYLEFLGTDEQFRRDHHQRLLDYYHQELTLALMSFNLDANTIYSRETFDNELKELLPVALLITAVILPLVTVEAERAPTLGGEANLEDIAVSPNELFAERFTGIVSDYVRWGIL